jgi:hypothetical protein
MSLEQALAILVITVLGLFTLWGRTGAGQATLTRWFGPPRPQPAKYIRRPTRSQPHPKQPKSGTRSSTRPRSPISQRAKRQ